MILQDCRVAESIGIRGRENDATDRKGRMRMTAGLRRQQNDTSVADKGLITIDEASGVPIWMQLRNRLVFLVVSGAFPPGTQLPTIRELAAFLNVNYNTVSKVYRDIEKDGYVITRRGKGTSVAEVNSLGYEARDGKAAADLLVDKYFEDCKGLGLSEVDAASLVAERAGGVFV